jgi:hypothetical protein
VFLIDTLDNPGLPGPEGSGPLDAFLKMVAPNTVVLAGQPSAEYWVDAHNTITLLRLQPLGADQLALFFGESYERALDLCRQDERFLGSPLRAHMVKTLLESRESRTFQSTWDLYARFVKHIVREHRADRQEPDHRQWWVDVTHDLGLLSYLTLDQPTQESESIPSHVVAAVGKDLHKTIDALAATGLGDLQDGGPTAVGPSFSFQHRTLLDFFAALWVAGNQGLVDPVIREWWNPKWHHVLHFLVGAKGSSIIEAIYPDECREDPIHSRLLLAADCARETRLSGGLEARLVSDLARLLSHPLYGRPAVRALVSMGSGAAQEVIWSIIQGSTDRSDIYDTEDEDLLPLYSGERMDWLFDHWDRTESPPRLWMVAMS